MHYESISYISNQLRSRKLSPVEVTSYMLKRISEQDTSSHSYVTVCGDYVMRRAELAEAEIRKGQWRGPLHGIPIGIKDLIYTSFATTTAGTTLHQAFLPSYNATVVDRLEKAGALILGKLKTTEQAITDHHPSVIAPVNPWANDRWPGVSSSGSGVATAKGLAFASLGTDTGGSIRLPSAANGLTSIKPTWGRVSRYGVFPLADSLDHVGPMARSAIDAGFVFNVIAGADPHDPSASCVPLTQCSDGIVGRLGGSKIGLPTSYVTEGTTAEIFDAWRSTAALLGDLGAQLCEISYPSIKDVLPDWNTIATVESAVSHIDTFPERRSEYGPVLGGFVDAGHRVSATQFAQASIRRLSFSEQVKALFQDVNLFLVPVIGTAVPTTVEWGRLAGANFAPYLQFTIPADMTGGPTVTFPVGFDSNGLPIAMQLCGPHFSEHILCQVVAAYQQATDWHTYHPVE